MPGLRRQAVAEVEQRRLDDLGARLAAQANELVEDHDALFGQLNDDFDRGSRRLFHDATLRPIQGRVGARVTSACYPRDRMLTADRHTKVLTVSCDKCQEKRDGLGTDREAATRELADAGWYEAARAGRGRERWLWWCPEHAPRDGRGARVATTPDMKPAKE